MRRDGEQKNLSNIDLSKVDDLIEARKRFRLFEKKLPEQITDLERQGNSVNEAGIVMLSAALQSFVENVFLECSFKAFGRELIGKELEKYRSTWRDWGNPNSKNITHLFRRLGINNVLKGVPVVGFNDKEVTDQLDMLNSVRNCIAHGSIAIHDGATINVNLRLLQKWRTNIDRISLPFKFHALHSSGLGTGVK